MKKNKKRRYWVHPLNTRKVYESPFYMKRASYEHTQINSLIPTGC
nr:unnamed protein product [Callosobruchus chinensis]CAH7726395.1 unnamed protein product [Callosobruchus chinensis]CAH7727640.1 unnamed protein product [Callosobruchus chinensis]CAH7728781.1 unnamed protein product [Callosobruchus chinensis]CAH7733075.1 unnamed protein product [Callosobruchus chinensis]